jgi:membrane fusion protein, macrolide-specific efflux system
MSFLRVFVTAIMRHRFLTLVIVGSLLAVSVLWNRMQQRSAGTFSEPLKRGVIIESVYGIGTVTANRSFQIRPGVSVAIHEIFVNEGNIVKKGDSLIRLDDNIYSAPFNGTVTSLPFKVGENLYPQDVALALVDLKDRYLVASLEQQGALQVRAGQKVKINFDTLRDRTYDGVVDAIYSNKSNFLARISVADFPPMILPDMTADIAVEIRRQENGLLIPVAALEVGQYVWRKRGASALKQVEVKTGMMDRAMAEIISGDVLVDDRVLIRKELSK